MREADLIDKLRKVEALFAGAKTPGEKAAAGQAAEKIRARLRQAESREAPVEIRFSVPDPWARQLFCALCRRYGLRPYRYSRMQRQSIMVRSPQSFVDGVLWPEFQQLEPILQSYLAEVTERVIREAIHGESSDAETVAEPPGIGR
jgi:hypothetical protein